MARSRRSFASQCCAVATRQGVGSRGKGGARSRWTRVRPLHCKASRAACRPRARCSCVLARVPIGCSRRPGSGTLRHALHPNRSCAAPFQTSRPFYVLPCLSSPWRVKGTSVQARTRSPACNKNYPGLVFTYRYGRATKSLRLLTMPAAAEWRRGAAPLVPASTREPFPMSVLSIVPARRWPLLPGTARPRRSSAARRQENDLDDLLHFWRHLHSFRTMISVHGGHTQRKKKQIE